MSTFYKQFQTLKNSILDSILSMVLCVDLLPALIQVLTLILPDTCDMHCPDIDYVNCVGIETSPVWSHAE